MCLSVITKRFKKPDGTVRVGWKAFELNHGELIFPFMGSCAVRGKWLKAHRTTIVTNGVHENYLSGFHVYAETMRKRMTWAASTTVMKVEIRGVETEGTDGSGGTNGARVLVAREMRVVGKVGV